MTTDTIRIHERDGYYFYTCTCGVASGATDTRQEAQDDAERHTRYHATRGEAHQLDTALGSE